MKISKKQKELVSFSCNNGQSTLKLGSQVKRCTLLPPHGHTYTQIDRMTTEGTLSGHQDFFLQPIMKDWTKIYIHVRVYLKLK